MKIIMYKTGWIAGCLLAAGALQADVLTWTNSAGGSFSTPASWNPNRIPNENDTAIFNAAGNAGYTVDFDASVSNKAVEVADDHVVWQLNDQTYTVLGKLLVATANGGHLTITGGILRLPLTGSDFRVPYDVVSTVTNSGSLEIIGADTTVDLGGTNWLKVLNGEKGSLLIRNATVKNVYGFDPGGRVTIDGGLVTNVTRYANIGRDEVATVVITNGGKVFLPATAIGHTYESSLLITGVNSLYQSGSIQYALNANASSVITNGATMRIIGPFYLGYATAPYTGSVVVADGSLLEVQSGHLMLGGHNNAARGGRGHLTVLEGGSVVCDKSVYVWTNSILRLSGGSLSIPNYNSLFLNGGTMTGHGQILIPSGGSILQNLGGLVQVTGPLVFGNYAYTQNTSGRLEFVLGGRNEGEYGRVALMGTPANCPMTLAGTCTVTLAPGFKLQDKDSFDVLKWGTTLSGTFDTIELPQLKNGTWNTDELYTIGRISVRIQPGTVISIR